MTDVLDQIAGQIGSAKVEGGEGGTYPQPGSYLLFVDLLKTTKNWEGHNCVIACFDVIESTCEQRPKGSRMDDAYNLSKQPKFAPGDVRAMLAAIAGLDPKIDEQFTMLNGDRVKQLLSEANPAHGRLVRLEARNKDKVKSEGVFTIRKYSPVPDAIQAQAVQLRESAGFSPF